MFSGGASARRMAKCEGRPSIGGGIGEVLKDVRQGIPRRPSPEGQRKAETHGASTEVPACELWGGTHEASA